ncbi:tetratricopeptide repeat protein [bacterium]|nr:MAG: tetratricopeptide repeat protein [bacterium]
MDAALRIYRDMVRRGLMGYGENRERIEILSQVKSDTLGLRPLLESIGSKATKPLPKLDDVAPVLKPFVAYHAADNLGLSDLGEKGGAYLRVAQTYPQSTRAEPSLIMAARVILTDRGPNPSLPEMRIAHSALQKLLADYPDSRFRANALGWLGRIDRHQGRLLEAEAKYERQFSASRLQRDRLSALDSLAEVAKLRKRRDLAALAYLRKFGIASGNPYEQVQHLQGRIDSFNGTDARLFSDALHKYPELLLAYLNYRIQFTELSSDVLRFGHDLLRFPKAERLKVAVKLAEASMRLGQSLDAKRYVSMTRGHGIEGDDAALAEFLHGTLEMRAGRYISALRSFRTIRSRYGKSYLVPGAMENLTILSERTGRLGDALQLYHEMGYRHDFAYIRRPGFPPRPDGDLEGPASAGHGGEASPRPRGKGIGYVQDGELLLQPSPPPLLLSPALAGQPRHLVLLLLESGNRHRRRPARLVPTPLRARVAGPRAGDLPGDRSQISQNLDRRPRCLPGKLRGRASGGYGALLALGGLPEGSAGRIRAPHESGRPRSRTREGSPKVQGRLRRVPPRGPGQHRVEQVAPPTNLGSARRVAPQVMEAEGLGCFALGR